MNFWMYIKYTIFDWINLLCCCSLKWEHWSTTIMMNLANNNNKSEKAKSLRIINYSDQIKYNNLIISKNRLQSSTFTTKFHLSKLWVNLIAFLKEVLLLMHTNWLLSKCKKYLQFHYLMIYKKLKIKLSKLLVNWEKIKNNNLGERYQRLYIIELTES